MTDIWENAIKSIKSRINGPYFAMWIEPITCVQADEDDHLLLRAPTQYIKDWFADNYLGIVLDEIRSQTGRELRVDFTIEPQDAEKKSLDSDTYYMPPEERMRHEGAVASENTEPPRLDLIARYTFDTFVVGPSNDLAHAAARAVADWPAEKYNPLFIYGGVGLGKTHLLHAIGHAIHAAHPSWRILSFNAEGFLNEYVAAIRNNQIDVFRRKYREHCDVLLVDDAQFFANKDRTQEEFFHTFRSLFESHRQIVLTADTMPQEMQGLAERIRSRFEWGLIADIQPPDLEMRIAILLQKASHRQVDLPREVAEYVATHSKSNVRELEGLLGRLEAASSLHRRPITLEFAHDMLCSLVSQLASAPTIEGILREVANYYNVKLVDLKSPRRHQTIARPRQIAMYLARKLVRSSFPEIGRAFGGKDHTTVMAAYRKIDLLLSSDLRTRHEVHELEQHFAR